MHARPYSLRILEHTVPPRMDAGDTCGVRVTMENTGAMTWPVGGAHPVHLFVLVDDVLYQVVPLPHGDVAPGRSVTWHFALRIAAACLARAACRDGVCRMRWRWRRTERLRPKRVNQRAAA